MFSTDRCKPGANLTRANLTGADLTGANLTRANLTRADLTRANLTRADLTGADLTGANLTRANLTGANLTRANLTRANLTRADLTGADLTRAKGVFEAGRRSDGYLFLIWSSGGRLQVLAGCRSLPMPEARDHWQRTRGGTPLGDETFAILDLAETLGRARGMCA